MTDRPRTGVTRTDARLPGGGVTRDGAVAGAADGQFVTPVGQSVERADSRLKLSGQAEFTGDLRISGMLYGAVLHSPYARARIRSIDTAAAENLAAGDRLGGFPQPHVIGQK